MKNGRALRAPARPRPALSRDAVLIGILLALGTAMPLRADDVVERSEVFSDTKGSRELIYRDNVLAEERVYDTENALQKEITYDESSLPLSTKVYIRKSGRVLSVEDRDQSDNIVGTMTYHYDRVGRLVSLSSTGSLGEEAMGMIAARGVPQGAWIAAATTTVLAYDEAGRAIVSEIIKDGKVISMEKRSYDEKSGNLSFVEREDSGSGLKTKISYDEKGRSTLMEEIPAKGLSSSTAYAYGDSGKLEEETKTTGSHKTAISYSYDEKGEVSRAETRRDGILLLAVDYIENGRIEELYEEGELFVKATYIGGHKVKDEFFMDGQSLRVREYK
jgi:Uncharacterized protein conserved in bacteria